VSIEKLGMSHMCKFRIGGMERQGNSGDLLITGTFTLTSKI